MKNVLIDNKKSTLEIQLGDRKLGDKCYTRINSDVEQWFENLSDTRDDIIQQGLDILKRRLEGKNILYPNGTVYDWQ
jgi:hypothetical protein